MKKIFVLITVLIPFYVSSKDYFRPDTALLVSAIEEYWGNNSWNLEGKEINSYDDLKRPVFHSESWLDEVGADGHFWNYGNDSTKYEIVYFYDDIDSKEWIFARRDSFYVHHESDTVIVRYIRNGV